MVCFQGVWEISVEGERVFFLYCFQQSLGPQSGSATLNFSQILTRWKKTEKERQLEQPKN